MSEETLQSGLTDNAAAGLAYVTVIPAIIFLVVAPYNRSSYVRFHAWQSIFFAITYVVLDIAIHVSLGVVPFMRLMGLLLYPLLALAMLALWIVVMIKAFNGQRFKLPVIGDLAERQAGL